MNHGFLAASYWAEGIPRETVERAIAGCPSFGRHPLRENGRQMGFARLTTDRATLAYLADPFVLDVLDLYRGRGLGKWLVDTMLTHPDLQGLRVWMFVTRHAHGLYRQYGFTPLPATKRNMVGRNPAVYKKRQAGVG
ncbi:MAG: GNAT family N-acetyltransferase [Chloroflexota bacterium]|nr:GNAT family N-acetyltransferase [Chloroflexota bacterium]